MKEEWLETDEIEDVAGSIRHAIRTAQFINEDPQAWKWVVLALHGALQGACICHVTTTASPIGAVTDKNMQEWLSYDEGSRLDPDARSPKAHLKTLPELIKAMRKPYSAGDRGNTSGTNITDFELEWIRRLHDDIRNQFVHFKPTTWSIDVSGIPNFAKLVARIIEDIDQYGWAFRNQDTERREEMRKDIRNLASIDSIIPSTSRS